jgi:hypothetical protein
MAFTAEDLLVAGYKRYHDSMEASKMGDWYQASYQKRIVDERGTRYFITVTHNHMRAIRDHAETHFFTPSNQFSSGDRTINIQMQPRPTDTVADVETFFADLWVTMRLDYYETSDGSDTQV